jgi:hypothetical protein
LNRLCYMKIVKGTSAPARLDLCASVTGRGLLPIRPRVRIDCKFCDANARNQCQEKRGGIKKFTQQERRWRKLRMRRILLVARQDGKLTHALSTDEFFLRPPFRPKGHRPLRASVSAIQAQLSSDDYRISRLRGHSSRGHPRESEGPEPVHEDGCTKLRIPSLAIVHRLRRTMARLGMTIPPAFGQRPPRRALLRASRGDR